MASLLRNSTGDRLDARKHSKTILLISLVKSQFNMPFAASRSRDTHPPCWRARYALRQDKQRAHVIFLFFADPRMSLALHRSIFSFFNQVNGQLLRACREGKFRRCTKKNRMLRENCQDSPHDITFCKYT